MTTVTHHTGDTNIRIAFHLSSDCKDLSRKFLLAAQGDKAFTKDIEKGFVELLEHRIKMAMGIEKTDISVEKKEMTKNPFTVNISLPEAYRSTIVIDERTIDDVAKHPALLRQVEIMLLSRHNKLG